MALFERNKTCPGCGKSVPGNSKFCISCGYAFERNKTCPGCGKWVAKDAKFCTHCGRKFGSKLPALEPVPGHGGLSRWARSATEIARRLDVTELKTDRLGVRQGLLIRPGERAVVIGNGEMVDVLEAGNYALSDKGLGIGVAARLLNHLSGTTQCEVVLVDDGEFPVYLRGRTAEELSAGLEKVSQALRARSDIPAATPEEHQDGQRAVGAAAKEGGTPGTREVRDKGIEERVGAAGVVLDELTGLVGDFPKNVELKKRLEDAQGNYARILQTYADAYSKAYESSNLLRVRTREGHYVNLGLEIYFRVEGNMEFVNSLLRHKRDLDQKDLIDKVSPLLGNLLESVVKEVSVRDLYGNLALRERINDAFVEQLAPTLSGWGLCITRTAGQTWDFAEYEQIERLRALLEHEKESQAIQQIRTRKKHDMEMVTLELEVERDLRKQAAKLAHKRGKLQARDIEHQAQIERERREREAQLASYAHYKELHHEDRRRAHQLEQERLDAGLRREIEKRRADSELWKMRASFMADLSPAQILTMFADQNPQLVPALEAYWRAQAGEREMKLIQGFQQQLQEMFGKNETRVQAVMTTALEQIGRTAQTGLRSSQVKVLPHGNQILAFSSKQDPSPGGRILCGNCHHEIPREKVIQRICPDCGHVIDE